MLYNKINKMFGTKENGITYLNKSYFLEYGVLYNALNIFNCYH